MNENIAEILDIQAAKIETFLQEGLDYDDDTEFFVNLYFKLANSEKIKGMITPAYQPSYESFMNSVYKFILCGCFIDKTKLLEDSSINEFMRERVKRRIEELKSSTIPAHIANRLYELEDTEGADIYGDKRLMALMYYNDEEFSYISKEHKNELFAKEKETANSELIKTHISTIDDKKKLNSIRRRIAILLCTFGLIICATTGMKKHNDSKKTEIESQQDDDSKTLIDMLNFLAYVGLGVTLFEAGSNDETFDLKYDIKTNKKREEFLKDHVKNIDNISDDETTYGPTYTYVKTEKGE